MSSPMILGGNVFEMFSHFHNFHKGLENVIHMPTFNIDFFYIDFLSHLLYRTNDFLQGRLNVYQILSQLRIYEVPWRCLPPLIRSASAFVSFSALCWLLSFCLSCLWQVNWSIAWLMKGHHHELLLPAGSAGPPLHPNMKSFTSDLWGVRSRRALLHIPPEKSSVWLQF